MTILYSESGDQCYDTIHNHPSYPNDAIEITQEQFEAYFLNNAPSGQTRQYDSETSTFSWVNITYTEAEVLAQCKASLASKRWDMTEHGVTVDGVAFQTDQDSKSEMSGYVSDGVTEVHWKHSDGSIVTYPIAEFTDVYHLVQQYRNDCFGVEKSKVDAMDTATDPTTVDIETGWPDTTFTTS